MFWVLKIKVISQDGNELYIGPTQEKACCVYSFAYQKGDWIIVDCDKRGGFYKVRLEDTMQEAILYVPGSFFEYHIPDVEERSSYSPKSFSGHCHIITVEEASKKEIYNRRNLAFNPYDQHQNTTFFPHSSANVETRNEAVFASRNAIDGFYFNTSHGKFPYQSWGINRNPNAEFRIDFGREVIVDEIVLTLRADFPHDNYWKKASIFFSDNSILEINLKKTGDRQSITFEPKIVSFIVLKNLIKAEGDSEFPALTQFEAWGHEKERKG